MTLNTLRYLDRKIGIPLCYLAYFSKKFLFRHNCYEFEKEKVKKILVIKIWGIGSIVLASPTFQNLKINFPDSEIWFLTQEGLEYLYPTKFFSHIETIRLNGFFPAIINFLKLIVKFRRQKFDLVIDLEIVSRYTALISYFCGAKTKVGFEIMGQNKDKLYDVKAIFHEGKHVSKMFLSTLDALGLKTEFLAPSPPEFSSFDEDSVDSLLKKNNGKNYVVININASELAYERRLPLDFFKLIIQNIKSGHPDYLIVLIGSKKEKEYVGKFISFVCDKNIQTNPIFDSKIIDLSGLLSLAELSVLLKNAKAVVSNDSGPAQISASFNTPSVIFFGPESPAVYKPLNENVKIFYADTHCSPCISVYRDKKINCRYNQKCLRDLDVNLINKAIDEFLE